MEFSQRPGTHGFAAAAPPLAHYQSPPGPADAYLGAPRRLPSLTELLVSQESAQQIPRWLLCKLLCRMAHCAPSRTLPGPIVSGWLSRRYAAFGVPVYLTADSQRTACPIDLPAPVATQYRDSESASSSVSSQGTLIDTCLSADHHYAVAKQVHQHPGRAHTHMSSAGPFAASQTIQLASGMCEEDVFAAASILMSLRTCKLPC
ncbi:hypothetical protein GGF39_002547 [Coemansia sp. RSA 1721]|nr:hypothetical protein GGF39_002547 [Coemansia sp. RSA 1721]